MIQHEAVVGVDYARQTYDSERYRDNFGGEIDIETGVSTLPQGPAYPFARGFDRKIQQVGVYAQDQLKIADKLVLLAGGRQDWAKTDLAYDTPQLFGAFPKQKDHAFTGRLGAVYLAPYGFAPYVSWSESFSPAIIAEQQAGKPDPVPLKPTTGEQVEGGLRWISPDQKTMLTGSVYRIEQKNVITTDANGDLRQSGLVRSKGFEFEAKSRWSGWQVTASYAYTDAKTIKDSDPTVVGQQLATVPRHQASLWALYDFTSVGAPGLSIGGGVRYFGKTNLDDDPLHRKVPHYVMADAVARLELGAVTPAMKGFVAQINAKNLFDKKTYSCAFDARRMQLRPAAHCDRDAVIQMVSTAFSRRGALGAFATAAVSATACLWSPSPVRAAARRVVSLELQLTEILVSLGAPPVAAADNALYRRLIGAPELPVSVADLGPIQQPNLEFLQHLAPDLIVVPAWEGSASRATLARVAPVTQVGDFAIASPLDRLFAAVRQTWGADRSRCRRGEAGRRGGGRVQGSGRRVLSAADAALSLLRGWAASRRVRLEERDRIGRRPSGPP